MDVNMKFKVREIDWKFNSLMGTKYNAHFGTTNILFDDNTYSPGCVSKKDIIKNAVINKDHHYMGFL